MTELGPTEPFLAGSTAGATDDEGAFTGATGATGPSGGTALMPTPLRAFASRPSDGWHPYEILHSVVHPRVIEVVPVRLHPAAPSALDAVILFLAICALIRAGAIALQHVMVVLLRLPLRLTS